MNDKVYVGNGKQIDTQYGKLLKLSFSRADLAVLENHLNEKGYVNLNCNERKSVSEWGHTHSMQIDDWSPSQQQEQGAQRVHQTSHGQQAQANNQQAGVTQIDSNFDNFDENIPF